MNGNETFVVSSVSSNMSCHLVNRDTRDAHTLLLISAELILFNITQIS